MADPFTTYLRPGPTSISSDHPYKRDAAYLHLAAKAQAGAADSADILLLNFMHDTAQNAKRHWLDTLSSGDSHD